MARSKLKAREGQWYSDRSSRDVFCVIAVDEADGYIDVRDRYGDIDEFDFNEWERMDLEPCDPPVETEEVEEASEREWPFEELGRQHARNAAPPGGS